MIEILHDFMYRNYRSYGNILYVGSCRVHSINSSEVLALGFDSSGSGSSSGGGGSSSSSSSSSRQRTGSQAVLG